MTSRACSGCAALDDLYVVTRRDAGRASARRVLLQCPRCRAGHGGNPDISWPLRLLTPGAFLELYRLGKTDAAPRMAVDTVFGPGHEWIATEATDILERLRLE